MSKRNNTLLEYIRPDGLRIITKRMPYTKTLKFGVITRVGSAYDDADKHGQFHFFEHMAFKGTSTKSQQEINRLRERYLLSHNATTGQLETQYFASVPANRLKEVCDLILDIYQNSVFPEDEIQREKEVVLNEIARNKDNDHRQAYFGLCQLLWKSNALRKPGTGSKEGLDNISRDLLISTRDKWHVPNNTIVIVAGKLVHEDVINLVNQYIPLKYSALPYHRHWEDEINDDPLIKINYVKKPDRNKAIIYSGLKIPVSIYSDLRQLGVFHIMVKMLAQGTTSILWNEIREKRGFAYTVNGGGFGHERLGKGLVFQIESLPNRVSDICSMVPEIIVDYKLDPDKFTNSKEALLDRFRISMQDPESWYDEIEETLLWHPNSTNKLNSYLSKIMKSYSAVTFDEVVEMRERLIRPEKIATFVITP